MIATLHLTNAWHPESGGVRTFYLALLAAAEREQRQMTLIVPGDRSAVQCCGRTTRIWTIKAPRVPLFDRRYRALLPHRFVTPIQTEVRRIIAATQSDLIEKRDAPARRTDAVDSMNRGTRTPATRP